MPLSPEGCELPTLGLMARHGIGEFHLERVEMRVLADLLEALDFTFDVEVILLDLVANPAEPRC